MSLYVLKTTYDEKIEELEGKISALELQLNPPSEPEETPDEE
jgi:hypothetical protein